MTFASKKHDLRHKEDSSTPLLNGLIVIKSFKCLPVSSDVSERISSKQSETFTKNHLALVENKIDQTSQLKDAKKEVTEKNANSLNLDSHTHKAETKTHSAEISPDESFLSQDELIKRAVEHQEFSITQIAASAAMITKSTQVENVAAEIKKKSETATERNERKSAENLPPHDSQRTPQKIPDNQESKVAHFLVEKNASNDLLSQSGSTVGVPKFKSQHREQTSLRNVSDDLKEIQKKQNNFSFRNLFTRKEIPAARKNKYEKMITVPKGDVEESNFFFRATDDELLYNLGDSFYRDYKKGLKHFAFAHVNSNEAQKRSILGVASFIRYFEDCKILIITSDMDSSYYAPFKNEAVIKTQEISGIPGFTYNVFKSFSLYYLEVEEISSKAQTSKIKQLPKVLKKLMEDYNVVLFDLPPVSERKDKYDVYLPILQAIDHVTFTISLRKSRFSEIKEMKSYFSSYKIKINGSVVDRYSKI